LTVCSTIPQNFYYSMPIHSFSSNVSQQNPNLQSKNTNYTQQSQKTFKSTSAQCFLLLFPQFHSFPSCTTQLQSNQIHRHKQTCDKTLFIKLEVQKVFLTPFQTQKQHKSKKIHSFCVFYSATSVVRCLWILIVKNILEKKHKQRLNVKLKFLLAEERLK